MRRTWLLACLILPGCSERPVAAQAESEISPSRELIPAEWTIAEDTAADGEISTTSLQLPAAKDIAGLMDGEPPRLALRCLNGKVAAFIDTEEFDSAGEPSDSSASALPISIRLDSAPSCE